MRGKTSRISLFSFSFSFSVEVEPHRYLGETKDPALLP